MRRSLRSTLEADGRWSVVSEQARISSSKKRGGVGVGGVAVGDAARG